ncbi:MAG: ComF family protein [Rhodospirillaceae bacterium]|nr:ComF family protein [Rhodospirillaceae bacterium]
MGVLGAAARIVLNALLPPQCLACTAVVDDAGALCGDCFGRMTFVAPPLCAACGMGLDGPAFGEATLCGACIAAAPVYGRARAVFVYDEASRGLVLKLKHGDRTDAAVHLARWLQRAGAELLAGCDVIVPVPLHRWRLLMRTYNQAALLANALGKLAGKPVAVDALRRVKATPSQGGLSRAARARNVGRAFAVAAPAPIAGKRVLLIDDVFTTGATAEACARALLDAGATAVDVLVLARVPALR